VIVFGTAASVIAAQVSAPLAAMVVANWFAAQSAGLAASAVAVLALPVSAPTNNVAVTDESPVSVVGMSAAHSARNTGVPAPAQGPANTVPCAALAHVSPNVPDVITGEPVTVSSAGAVSVTLVTVPVPPPPDELPTMTKDVCASTVAAISRRSVSVRRFMSGKRSTRAAIESQSQTYDHDPSHRHDDRENDGGNLARGQSGERRR
jgi:hypothetical protein